MPILNTLGGGSVRSFGGVGGGAALPPVNTVAPVLSGSAVVGQTLSCTTGTWTHDLGISGYAYQWYNNTDGLISGATSSTYVLQSSDDGDTVKCEVTATSNAGTQASADSNNSGTVTTAGQDAYTTPGSYSWTAPSGVTSVSIVAVGGGGVGGPGLPGGNGQGGGGAGLGYKNNYSVTPGSSYTVVVGGEGNPGSDSYFVSTATVNGDGGGNAPQYNTGGSYTGDGGGDGGNGGVNGSAGGGGAGGYSGGGGNGGTGAGGNPPGGAGGGGVGILGQGTNGVGGFSTYRPGQAGSGGAGGGGGGSWGNPVGGGGGGSGGTAGTNSSGQNNGTAAGSYGGGGGNGASPVGGSGGPGGGGAVRIIWPGTTRQFPSTGTEDQ